MLRRVNDEYQLDVISSYEALYCSVFGVKADSFSYSQDSMCRRLFDELIDTLDEAERKVIGKLFGYREKKGTRAETAELLGVSETEVDGIKERALEKLRSPENYRFMEQRWYSDKDIRTPGYELDYKKVLVSEIDRYLSGDGERCGYFGKILTRNGFDVSREVRPDAQADEVAAGSTASGKIIIDDIVSTLKDFKIAANVVEAPRRRRRTRRCVETIYIVKDGVAQPYRYRNLSDADIAGCVYQVMSEDYSEFGCILDYNISDELMSLLLMKGYFYIEDVTKDAPDICAQLDAAELTDYSRELGEFADKAAVYMVDKKHGMLTFAVIPERVAARIYERQPADYTELIDCFEITDRDAAVRLMRNVREAFEDFADLKITQDAHYRLSKISGEVHSTVQ